MALYKDSEKRKEIIKEYLKSNPQATFGEIKKILHTKIDKVYLGGMAEAFADAGLKSPRNFHRKTNEEKRKIVIEYIRKNPLAGGHTIRKETKINFQTIFKNIKEAFESAGLPYPREQRRSRMLRNRDSKRLEIISFLKKHPLIGVEELGKKFSVHFYLLFKNSRELYQLAGMPFISGNEKRSSKKRLMVMRYIQNHPFATQREVNMACRTHVQILFRRGIFEAYEKAGVPFPYERLHLHGAAKRDIRQRASAFEESIALRLSGFGSVHRLMRTTRGFADIILERKGNRTAVELKDYHSHEISLRDVRQLVKYLEDIGCTLGFLICRKKPKKDSFIIGKNKIFVLEESEIAKVPQVMDRVCGEMAHHVGLQNQN